MPFSSGSYSFVVNSWNPAVAATNISATDWNAQVTDLSSALSTCVLKDGTQTTTALVPFAQSLRVGTAGSILGFVEFAGNTSGTTRLQPAAIASGTLTLPAATDTLVGRATTDTLTNKTITSPSIGGTVTGGATYSGITLSGTTTLPGSGSISSGGSLTIGAGQSITAPTITTASGALSLQSANNQIDLLTGAGSASLYTSGGNTVFQNQSASFLFATNAGTTQFQVAHTASAVNYWNFSGAASGNNPYMQVAGSDSNIGIHWLTKGDGAHRFYSRAGFLQFAVNSSGSNAVNNFSVQGGASGVGVYLTAEGSDTNIDAYYSSKGAGPHRFFTNGTTNTEQFRILHTASANRYVTVSGANGANPAISVNGGELAVGTNAWTFGIANVVSPTSPNRTLTVTIGGTTYYIAAKTTND